MIGEATVERALHALFIAAEGAGLRREERKKVAEITAFLRALGPLDGGRLLVDAAAGKAYLGLLAVELCGLERLHVIERSDERIEACRRAAARLEKKAAIELCTGDVGDRALFPAEPDVIAALHACGEASDRVLEAALTVRTRWLYLVPCCYARTVPFAKTAERAVESWGAPRQAEVRRRLVMGLIDAERTLRLEAAGYEVTVMPFVAPTVTPHNLLWRARRVGETVRMRAAAERLSRLRQTYQSAR